MSENNIKRKRREDEEEAQGSAVVCLSTVVRSHRLGSLNRKEACVKCRCYPSCFNHHKRRLAFIPGRRGEGWIPGIKLSESGSKSQQLPRA